MLHHRYHMATAKGYNRSPRNKNNENIPEAKHDTPTIIYILAISTWISTSTALRKSNCPKLAYAHDPLDIPRLHKHKHLPDQDIHYTKIVITIIGIQVI